MNNRQNELLRLIVETYIKKVKPAGSKSLVKKLKCSSATIRNDMAYLESLGYLEKTHISSGRVPSEAGYKYYVDNLMKPKELTGDEVLKLQTILNNKDLVISDAIVKCMEIISDITNYTSIVLGKDNDNNTLKQVSIVPIDDKKIVAVVVTNTGHVENKQSNIPETISMDELIKACELINRKLVGTKLSDINSKLEYEIKPIIVPNNIPNNLIGKKIKTYARVILKISVVILFLGFASTFIYAGIVADEESSFLVYLMVLVVTNIIIVLTFVFSYFSFLLVSGFGAIIEDINAIKNK